VIAPLPKDPSIGAVASSDLLDFNSEDDRLFVEGAFERVAGGKTAEALALAPGATVAIKLDALTSGREFPGRYELAGVYARSAGGADGRVTVAYDRGGMRVSAANGVASDEYGPVFTELKPLSRMAAGAGEDRLVISNTGGVAVLVDDVMLVDNRRVLVAAGKGGAGKGGDGLVITRRGLGTVVESVGIERRFAVRVSEAEGGWRLVEAGGQRAVFEAADGGVWAIYAGGASVQRGEHSWLTGGATGGGGRPGRVEVTTPGARVDREARGDGDQDGYDEALGCYRVAVLPGEGKSVTRRVGVRLVPAAGAPLVFPAIEIAGLKRGKAVVTVAGQLVTSHEWLADDRLLVLLPVRIDGPAVVNVMVE
jgi:hypothetical protein